MGGTGRVQSLMRRLTQRLDVRREGRSLILSRARAGYLLALVPVAAACALVLFLCFLRVPGAGMAHAKALYQIHMTAFTLMPLCLLCLAFGLTRLRSEAWDFDLARGQILLNGRLVCPAQEVQSVHLDRSFYNSDCQVLYLRTRARLNIRIAGEGVFGVSAQELRGKGLLVAAHLGVALVLKDAYVPGRPACGARRWGGKGRRRRLTRQPKHRPI